MTASLVRVLAVSISASAFAGAQVPTALKLKPATATHPEEFTAISSVRELSDGRILVTDQRDGRVVALDFAAGAVRPVGRQGRGPGEYSRPSRLHELGADSSLMVDVGGGRWLVFARDSIVRTVPPDDPALKARGVYITGADGRGMVLVRGTQQFTDGVAEFTARDSVAVMLVARASGKVDSVTMSRPLPRRMEQVKDAQGKVTMAMSLVTGILQVEEMPLLFADGTLAIVRIEPFRVDFRSPTGRWTLGAPVQVNRVKIDARERAAYIERNASSFKPAVPPSPFPVQKVPTAGDFPEFIPPFVNSSAMAGPDGLLIVRRSKSADYMQAHYLFIDRQGKLVGELTLPLTEEIVGAGPRTLYISVKDEDDILHIRRHPW